MSPENSTLVAVGGTITATSLKEALAYVAATMTNASEVAAAERVWLDEEAEEADHAAFKDFAYREHVRVPLPRDQVDRLAHNLGQMAMALSDAARVMRELIVTLEAIDAEDEEDTPC